ncbi:MAG: hypothetical protein R3B98_03610 [Hyphomonas sp.]
MNVILRCIAAAALLSGVFLAPAQAQTFNKKKPKTTTQVWSTDSTDIAIPGEQYGKYVWRQVGECKATWFSDGTLKTCEGIEGTKRWRLEDSGDFGDRVFWDPGPGPEPASDILTPSLLAVRANGRVTLVSLPSGKQTVTDYSDWVNLTDELLLGGGYYLEGPRAAGQPVTLSRVHDDGTVDAPVPGSDYNRFIQSSVDDPWCPFNSLAAAVPAENAPEAMILPVWRELRRVVLSDGAVLPASLDVEGDTAERCWQYHNQFYLAQRASDSTWSVIGTDGEFYSAGQTFPTAEAASAAVPDVLNAAAERMQVAEAEQAARDQEEADAAAAATLASAEAEKVRLAQIEEERAGIRVKARELLAAGKYEEAADWALSLDTGEWATYVLAWRDAPVSVYADAIQRLGNDPDGSADYKPWESKAALERRLNSINSCIASYGPSARRRTDNGKWLSTAPTQRQIDMIQLRNFIDMSPRELGKVLAFDASIYDWVWVDYGTGHDVINIPVAADDTPADADALARCDRNARAEN